jgi:hypothetical protein
MLGPDHNSRVTSSAGDPAAIAIAPVRGRRDFGRFIDYAYARNADDPRWIPPLRIGERERLTPRKNPFFEHAAIELFLARRHGAIVGRIGAVDDRLHEATHRDNAGMFGFFEADDADAARALLMAAERWAAARGRTRLRGPINPSLNDHAGLLVDGFDTDPMILMPHNPPEYAAFIEAAGYAKAKDLYAWLYQIDRQPPEYMARLAARLRDRLNVVIRPMNLSEFDREADRLRVLYCSAWERNWGFVPPTEAEFRRIAREMKPIFDGRCAVCAEAGGRMVACAIAIPDVNQALKGTGGRLFPLGLVKLLARRRYIDQIRLLLLGVDATYRTMGLYPLLLIEWHRQLVGGPYKRAELSWVLEDNRDVNQTAENVGARRYKTYRIYEKALA